MKHTDLPHDEDTEEYDHDPDSCVPCLARNEVKSTCRCGECCRSLIIEVLPEDAPVEPRIAEKGSPTYLPPEVTASGGKELSGYLLNAEENGGACVFFDTETNLCGIYQTRPLVCRLFNCDGEDRNDLVQLGILPPRV